MRKLAEIDLPQKNWQAGTLIVWCAKLLPTTPWDLSTDHSPAKNAGGRKIVKNVENE